MEYTILGELTVNTNYQARDLDVLTVNSIFAKIKAYVETLNDNVENLKDGFGDTIVVIGLEPPTSVNTLWVDLNG